MSGSPKNSNQAAGGSASSAILSAHQDVPETEVVLRSATVFEVNSKGARRMDFQTGDTVQLKSGGPTMTIEKVKGDEAWCIWFEEGSAERKAGRFNFATLVKDDGLPPA